LRAWSQGSAYPEIGPDLDPTRDGRVAVGDTPTPPPPRRRAAKTSTGPASRRDSTRPGALTPVRPAPRRQLPRDAWSTLPCWWSAQRWVAHVEAVYHRHYLLLRPQLVALTGGGLSQRSLLAVATAHAAAADFHTGRSSRPLLGETGGTAGLTHTTGLGARTITRARTFLRLAGLATEVAPGRHRTLDERLDTWERGHTARGWTADYALHPSTTHPGDNPSPITAGQQADGTPPSSGVVDPTPSRSYVVSTSEQREHRGASRPASTREPRNLRRASPDTRGLLLATKWARNPHTPRWVTTLPPGVWAALLALPARHDWTDRDLNQLLLDHQGTGHRIPHRPTRPIGFLSWLLSRLGDLTDRPCALDDARHAAELAAAAARKMQAARDHAQHLADRATAQAALGGAGHTAARDAARDAARQAARARGTGEHVAVRALPVARYTTNSGTNGTNNFTINVTTTKYS